MFSISEDLSLLEEKSYDMITDSGKALKFTSDDYGWCTSCSVFFIVSVKTPNTYLVSGKATSRKEIIPDQVTITRAVNQFERECFAYTVLKSTNDIVFNVKQI